MHPQDPALDPVVLWLNGGEPYAGVFVIVWQSSQKPMLFESCGTNRGRDWVEGWPIWNDLVPDTDE
jgi:hypothetical protein